MYESQDSVPVRDWITIGIVFLLLVVVIFLGVTFAENTNSSGTQVISGQLVTVSVLGTPQPKNGQNPPDQQPEAQQSGKQQQGGQIASAKDQKNANQMSFFQTFLLVLLGAAIFTVIISVLIALLVIQFTRIVRRLQKKTDNHSSGK